jgi:CO/xanthine dehydrogenase FAD-binding subunit
MAVAWRPAQSGSRAVWRDVRLAFGSVAVTPIRCPRTEAVLEGSPPTPEIADRAAEVLAAELAPIDDVRSTAEYRRVVAARILHRAIREAGGW